LQDLELISWFWGTYFEILPRFLLVKLFTGYFWRGLSSGVFALLSPGSGVAYLKEAADSRHGSERSELLPHDPPCDVRHIESSPLTSRIGPRQARREKPSSARSCLLLSGRGPKSFAICCCTNNVPVPFTRNSNRAARHRVGKLGSVLELAISCLNLGAGGACTVWSAKTEVWSANLLPRNGG